MVRNLILGLLCLALAGCAGSPSSPASMADAKVQKRQAVQAEPLTEEQQELMRSARQFIKNEQWGAASESLDKLESQRPEVSEIHAAIASVARHRGDQDKAMTAYRTAFDLNPHDAVAANNLALMLREEGRFREAAELLQEGLEYSPDTPDLHYNLAVISELYLLDLELALQHYRKFRTLTEQEGQLVAGWIADLERRLE